jgi:hypothetical protein
VPTVLKSGNLNLLEPSEPVQASNGIALLYIYLYLYLYLKKIQRNVKMNFVLEITLLTDILFKQHKEKIIRYETTKERSTLRIKHLKFWEI